MGILIGVNTLYRIFCFLTLFLMVGNGFNKQVAASHLSPGNHFPLIGDGIVIACHTLLIHCQGSAHTGQQWSGLTSSRTLYLCYPGQPVGAGPTKLLLLFLLVHRPAVSAMADEKLFQHKYTQTPPHTQPPPPPPTHTHNITTTTTVLQILSVWP